MQESELKTITESLYKQNLELAIKNKTLSLLSKLYDISLSPLSPAELAKKITTTIQVEFEFEMVALLNYSQHRDRLYCLAMAESARFQETEGESRFSSTELAIENASNHPFFSSVLRSKEMASTDDLQKIWLDKISPELVDKIEKEGHVRSTLVYPLISEGRIIGLLVIEINRSYDKLAVYEQESIKNITNVTAIALEKSILYEKLQISNQELAEANNRQEGLIHFISHQVKGFLTKSQAAFAGILEGDYGSAPPKIKDMAEIALRDNQQGVETVMSILNASNLKKGTVSFDKKPFNFRQSLEQQLKNRSNEISAKGLKLETDIKATAYTTLGDQEKLEKHVIGNLLDNAIKYTLHGGLKITLTKNNNKILLAIKDSGIGISEGDKKLLFTEGGRGRDSTKVNVDSTGYGLFIAKQVVETHDGKIWADSGGSGKGSTFYVELPTTNVEGALLH
jgi:signal transduction histidine kinase